MVGKSMGVSRRSAGSKPPACAARSASGPGGLGADLFIDPDAETASRSSNCLTSAPMRLPTWRTERWSSSGQSSGRSAARRQDARRHRGGIRTRLGLHGRTIGRGEETIIPRRDHRLEAGDHVRIVANDGSTAGDRVARPREAHTEACDAAWRRTNGRDLGEEPDQRGVQVVVVSGTRNGPANLPNSSRTACPRRRYHRRRPAPRSRCRSLRDGRCAHRRGRRQHPGVPVRKGERHHRDGGRVASPCASRSVEWCRGRCRPLASHRNRERFCASSAAGSPPWQPSFTATPKSSSSRLPVAAPPTARSCRSSNSPRTRRSPHSCVMASPKSARKESPAGQDPRGGRHAQLGRRGAPGTRVSQRK